MDPIQTPIQIPDFQPKPNYLKIIIFSVLIVLTLGLITYLLFQNQQLKKQSVNQQISPTVQVLSPTPKTVSSISIPPDETADWKTYANNKLGIEFMYPVEWPVPKEILQSINFNEKLIIVKGPFYDQVLQKDLNFDEYSVRSYGDETPRHDFNMNGFIGKRGLEKSVLNYSDIVVLAKNNKSTEIISIVYIYNPKKEDGKLFHQILSTFKFVESITEDQAINIVKTNYPEVKDIKRTEGVFNSSSDIKIKKEPTLWKIAFNQGWGDCPSGCINSQYWYFTVDNGLKAVKVGEYKRVFNSKTNSYIETGFPMRDFLD